MFTWIFATKFRQSLGVTSSAISQQESEKKIKTASNISDHLLIQKADSFVCLTRKNLIVCMTSLDIVGQLGK